MKKKILLTAAVIAFTLGFSLPVHAQPVELPDGTLFDPEYYAQANPDVAAVFGTDANLLYLHYVQFGKAEGRAPVSGDAGTSAGQASAGTDAADFDAAFYAQNNPDVVAALGTDPGILYQHYIQFGKAEGRLGSPAAQAGSASDYEMQVLSLVNAHRTSAGLSPLSWDDSLGQAADIRAEEITRTMSHTRPDGSSCFTVISQLGISGRTFGENIAAGQKTPEAVTTAWMNSPGHRANIMNGSFSRIGIGYYPASGGYRHYWVQLFAG